MPFGAQWGWSALIEFLATAAALGAVATVNVWLRNRSWYLIALATCLQVVAFLVKPTTAVPWLVAYAVPAVYFLMQRRSARESASTLSWLALPPFAGLLAASMWTRHADNIKAQDPYTVFLTSGNLKTWNFGTVDQRLDVNNWMYVISRIPSLAGSMGLLLAAVVVMLAFWRASPPAIALSLVPVAAVGIFFNLYAVHDYYLCAVYPAIILVVAAAVAGAARLVPGTFTSSVVVTAMCLSLLVLAWTSTQGRTYEANLRSRAPFPTLSAEIAAAARVPSRRRG